MRKIVLGAPAQYGFGGGVFPTHTTLCSILKTHLNDLQHLHPGDLAITIQVVHVESPVQFLFKAAPGGDGQGADELSEVDGAITVLVEGAEGVLCKLGGISVREELQRHKAGVRNRRKHGRREVPTERRGEERQRGSHHCRVAWLLSMAEGSADLPSAEGTETMAIKGREAEGEAFSPLVLMHRYRPFPVVAFGFHTGEV